MGKDSMNEGRCYYGIYKGIVADRKDPDKKGRLMLKVPQLFDDVIYKYWAEPKGMFTGNKTGSLFIPAVDDIVWVMFEGGDARFPVWSYGPFQDNEQIKELYDDSGEPTKYIIQTTAGNKITINDKDAIINITDTHGNEVELNKTGVSIVSEKISLGTKDGSEESAVLGEKLETLLNNLLDGIAQLTVMTAMGPSSVPINISTFQQLKAQQVKPIKSAKVTLDP